MKFIKSILDKFGYKSCDIIDVRHDMLQAIYHSSKGCLIFVGKYWHYFDMFS